VLRRHAVVRQGTFDAVPARRVLIVIAPERFRDEELAEAKHALEAAGHIVTVTSTRPGQASGMLGARIDIAKSVRLLDAADFAALVIAGGAGAPPHLWDNEPLRSLLRAMHAAGKPIGAICLAPPVLARAGVLTGKRATTFPDPRAIIELKRGGAIFVAERVVLDGTIVTGSGPEAAAAFGAALVQLVSV
jgi:protease I